MEEPGDERRRRIGEAAARAAAWRAAQPVLWLLAMLAGLLAGLCVLPRIWR